MTAQREADLLLRRAAEEAMLAVEAGHGPAGNAHRDRCLRYSARAREVLAAGDSAAMLDVGS